MNSKIEVSDDFARVAFGKKVIISISLNDERTCNCPKNIPIPTSYADYVRKGDAEKIDYLRGMFNSLKIDVCDACLHKYYLKR